MTRDDVKLYAPFIAMLAWAVAALVIALGL